MADKTAAIGYNRLSMNSKLLALLLLFSAALLLACGPTAAQTPSMVPAPAATELFTAAATEAPITERDGSDDVKVEVQQLFDTWNLATGGNDAALFHSILTRELARGCGLNELQSWLDQDDEFFMEAVMSSVYLDVTAPTRAYVELTARQRAGRPEEPVPVPWPVALEDGEWRVGFPTGWTEKSCPYMSSGPPPGPEGGEPDFPQIPGLDMERREEILAAVPGTRVVYGSFRTGNFSSSSSSGSQSPYDNQVNIYAELETESTAGELVRIYRDGLNHPSWDIVDEGSSDDFGWFSWTVLDGEGRRWHGRLVVVLSHEGWKQVWLSIYSKDA